MTIRLALASVLWLSVSSALAMPDLTPQIYGVSLVTGATVDAGDVTEGCAGATTGRTLLRFGTKVENVGDQDIVFGNPGCPDCTTHPGAACANPYFVCSPGLKVSHYQTAARFELLDPEGHAVVTGSKRGYCFNDDECTGGKTPRFTSCDYQGLSAGCIDVYEPFLPCQYLDVTDVPSVATRAFILRVTVDTADLIPDANRANNVTEVAIPGCGDGIVQAGEQCDPGPGRSDACCDASCHLAAAGTPCRASAGPCDAAETCDGTSAACPPDAAVADGTTCGAGDPCLAQTCRAGQCVASPDVAPDATGIRCQLDRLDAAVGGVSCGAHVSHSVAAPFRQLRHVIDRRLAAAVAGRQSRAPLVRAAQRLSRALARAAKHRGCDVAGASSDADVLMGQLRAL